jgi:hypothetical protein
VYMYILHRVAFCCVCVAFASTAHGLG